jgi:perosamine synthetase
MITLSKPAIGKEEINAVIGVLRSGQLAQGPLVEEFEKEFSKLSGINYAVAVNNGTSALHTALHCLGIRPGDEVITTPFTFVATANSILMAGAKPVFVDIEIDTFNINPKLIENKITKKTKAILAVDLYGQPANYREINKIAKKHKLFVIEDAAQAIGAEYFEKVTGCLADVACFSLYATKNITSGEGGVITTNDIVINEKARLFRNHGQSEKKYKYSGLGYNYRLTEFQAAIGLEQIKKINSLTARRQEIAGIYNENLQKIKGLVIPGVVKNIKSVYHQYTIRLTKDFNASRDDFKKYLESKGIQSFVYYPIPLYAFEHLSFETNPNDFPITERVVDEVLSIPVHPLLTNEEIYYIIDKIKGYGK